MSKVRVAGRQTTITFVQMHTGAKHMFQLAEANENGQLYTLVSSLVFSAFTMEAYLNHLGKLRNKDWDEVERKLPKLEKYKMFCKVAKLKVNLNVRPYLTLVRLFQFRDQMAHGKTTADEIAFELEAEGKKIPHLKVENDWQSFAKITHASEAIHDVEHMVKELHVALGYPGNPFARSGGGIYAVTKATA
jgi:hypothetical protein